MKYAFSATLTALTLISINIVAPAQAQTKKSKPPVRSANPVPKPPTRPTPASGPIVLGTNQLAGDFGQFGQTYTIGKQEPVNFTLNSVEYLPGRFNVGDDTLIPSDGEKLLVLHYTVHNPNRDEMSMNWASLRFTAVDRKDVNHEYKPVLVRDGTSERVDVSLKPAQKLNVQTVILVPADGVTPKLIVQREENAAVIRYDLRGKVKPLPAPFADPADTSGATLRKVVPAQIGAFYPLGAYDVRLDSMAYITSPVGEDEGAEEPAEGKRYVTFTITIRNAATSEYDYQWGTFQPELKDADGEKYAYNQLLLKATKNERAEGNLKPGEEIRARYYFVLGEESAAKTLTLTGWVSGNDVTHTLAFDVSSLSGK